MDKTATAEFVHKNQRGLIMDLDFYQFGELIDIRPEHNSPFVRSMSEPFSEEDIEAEVLQNWLDHFGMPYHQLHASGHLSREQIKTIVKAIDARKVFPVHTENAALFKKITRKVQIAQKEKAYSI